MLHPFKRVIDSLIPSVLKMINKEKKIENVPYASTIGNLMYAQVCTHPDIAFVISVLGRYLSKLGMDYWQAAKHVMRYLQGTKEHLLTHKIPDKLEVIEGVVSWKSVKYTLTATSTMKAEYIACYKVIHQVVWLRNFISKFHLVENISKPLTIYYDNCTIVCFS
ncbi:hypothetical protein CR513_31010, partial [Mucuna pruriens]